MTDHADTHRGAARVRASFARQGAMGTPGAELADVAAGRVAIALPIYT